MPTELFRATFIDDDAEAKMGGDSIAIARVVLRSASSGGRRVYGQVGFNFLQRMPRIALLREWPLLTITVPINVKNLFLKNVTVGI